MRLPQYPVGLFTRTDTQERHFKGNLHRQNAVFAFTSLGCDIISAEEHNVNGNRDIFKAFQIHNILCHCQGPLLPVKNNTSSYAAQRQSERNENLDHEIIRIRSAMLARPNPVARIYRHAQEILSNHESSNTKRKTSQLNNFSVSGSKRRVYSVLKCESCGTVWNHMNNALNIWYLCLQIKT